MLSDVDSSHCDTTFVWFGPSCCVMSESGTYADVMPIELRDPQTEALRSEYVSFRDSYGSDGLYGSVDPPPPLRSAAKRGKGRRARPPSPPKDQILSCLSRSSSTCLGKFVCTLTIYRRRKKHGFFQKIGGRRSNICIVRMKITALSQQDCVSNGNGKGPFSCAESYLLASGNNAAALFAEKPRSESAG